MATLRIGDIITATYTGTNVHDKFPQILVLHNNFQGLVHGLNLNYLTEQEINYVKSVINPEFGAEMAKKDVRIRQALQRLGTISLDIKSPNVFYTRFIKTFIQNKSAYRLYNPAKLINVRVITRREDLVPKKKPETGLLGKPQAPTTPKSQSALGQNPMDKPTAVNRPTVAKPKPPGKL
jgi:hypothetical protein